MFDVLLFQLLISFFVGFIVLILSCIALIEPSHSKICQMRKSKYLTYR